MMKLPTALSINVKTNNIVPIAISSLSADVVHKRLYSILLYYTWKNLKSTYWDAEQLFPLLAGLVLHKWSTYARNSSCLTALKVHRWHCAAHISAFHIFRPSFSLICMETMCLDF